MSGLLANRALLSWQLLRLWLRLPPFRGRDRVFFLWRRRLTSPREVQPVITTAGLRMLVNVNDEIDAEVFLFREFDPPMSVVARTIVAPGDAIIDVGANVGYFSLLFALAAGEHGRVVAFEPSPTTYERLVVNIGLNFSTRITPVLAAIGATRGQAVLTQPSPHRSGDAWLSTGTAPLLVNRDHAPFAHSTVLMDTIDGYCGRHNLSPAVLKVDVEGADLFVLRGAGQTIERNLPVLVLEFNESTTQRFNYSPDSIAAEMSAVYGYEFFAIQDGKLLPIVLARDGVRILGSAMHNPGNYNVLGVISRIHAVRLLRARVALARTKPRATVGEVWPGGVA